MTSIAPLLVADRGSIVSVLGGGVANWAAVAGTLWPDASESHAYSNLRSALARLERTCHKALRASKLEPALAEGVTVAVRHSQTLALGRWTRQ